MLFDCLLIILDPFCECLNLDIVHCLILDVVIDLSLILRFHVFDTRYHLSVQVTLVIQKL